MIKDNMPKDKKIKVLELGSRKGGLSRFVAEELVKINQLESLTAINAPIIQAK